MRNSQADTERLTARLEPIRIDEETKRELAELARRNQRSVAGEMRLAIQAHLKRSANEATA